MNELLSRLVLLRKSLAGEKSIIVLTTHSTRNIAYAVISKSIEYVDIIQS